jgi:hypothetical protein
LDDGRELVQEGGEVRPGVRLLLGEEGAAAEADLEGADGGVDDVLVGEGVDVLVLGDLEGDEVGGDEVAEDLEGGEVGGDEFGD